MLSVLVRPVKTAQSVLVILRYLMEFVRLARMLKGIFLLGITAERFVVKGELSLINLSVMMGTASMGMAVVTNVK